MGGHHHGARALDVRGAGRACGVRARLDPRPHRRRPRPRQGQGRENGAQAEAYAPPEAEAIKRRDRGEESLAEIGRSYNVSGWTIARLGA